MNDNTPASEPQASAAPLTHEDWRKAAEATDAAHIQTEASGLACAKSLLEGDLKGAKWHAAEAVRHDAKRAAAWAEAERIDAILEAQRKH